jgi:hypothetical protein
MHYKDNSKNRIDFDINPTVMGSTIGSVSMDGPKAQGDGTVHIGAGKFATNTIQQIAINTSADHQDLMNNSAVRERIYGFSEQTGFIQSILYD